MKDYYISYASADEDFATWVAEILEREGKTVFIQAWDILPGDNFVIEINNALGESEKLIVILSKHYLESKWCQEEWTSKLAQPNALSERHIIPIKIESLEATGLLKSITPIDVTNKSQEETRKLILTGLNGKKERISNGFPPSSEHQATDQTVDKSTTTTESVSAKSEFYKFINKLYPLYEKDGMMKCLYDLFKVLPTDKFTANDMAQLSIIQDEYLKLYNQNDSKSKIVESAAFDRAINDPAVKAMESSSHTHPLLITYLQFVRADAFYFLKQYDNAIEHYQKALDKIIKDNKDKPMSDNDECRCVYLMNSIAWSYRLRKNEGDIQKTIETYQEMYKKYKRADNYAFSPTYRRNYGAALEIAKRYTDAIAQYRNGLDANPNDENKGVLFTTLSTATMKYWDQETGKLSGHWIENVKRLRKDTIGFLSEEKLREIQEHLDFAAIKVPPRFLYDVHVQKAKVATYRLILSEDVNERKKYEKEIESEINFLKNLSSKPKGWHYIYRDYNYVLYKITSDNNERNNYRKLAQKENDSIKKFGYNDDSKQFGEMLIKEELEPPTTTAENEPNQKPIKPNRNSTLHKLLLDLRNLAICIGITILTFSLIYGVMRLIQSTGQLDLDLNNISFIHDMKASSIHALFVDDHEGTNEAYISFDNRSWLYTEDGFQMEVLTKEGKWISADALLITPKSNEKAQISIDDYPERMEYEIVAGSPKDEKGYPLHNSSLFYRTKTKDDFTYRISAPITKYYLLFPSDGRKFLSASISNCTMQYYVGDEEIGQAIKFRILTERDYDENNMDYTYASIATNRYDNNEIGSIFIFDPYSKSRSNAKTTIEAYYLKEMDMDCSGSMSWRYGELKEENLHNDRIQFVVSDDQIQSDWDSTKVEDYHAFMASEIAFASIEPDILHLGDSTASENGIPHHHPDTEFEITNQDDNRITKLELNRTVTDFSINSLDQFPNLGAFLLKNWIAPVIVTIIFFMVGQFTFFKPEDKKKKD